MPSRKTARKTTKQAYTHSSNRSAAEASIVKLREQGALIEVDEALVHAFLALASAVDAAPEKADLWREYRATGQALREAVAGGGDDDTASFLLTVQTPGRAKVGDRSKS
jgi:hypothetical protein